jgi:hypothetical protein
MLRISEIRLPLEHPPAALPAAVAARLGIAADRHRRTQRLPAQLRRAQGQCADLHLQRRRRGWPTKRLLLAKFAERPAGAADAGHALSLRRAGAGRWRRDRSSSASARPASLPRWFWRRAASGRSSSSAARPCASARRIPGGCGARRCSTRSRTCSSARAAPAPFPTASSTARSRIRSTTAARCSGIRQGRRAAGDPLRQQTAHRHLPAGRHGRADAPRDRARSAARSVSSSA